MKKQDLEKHLKKHSCKLSRQGGNHEIWINPKNKKKSAVPRHKEIHNDLCKEICKQLGVPVI